MIPIRIAVLIPIWKRQKLTSLVLDGIKRLNKDERVTLFPCLVYSRKEDLPSRPDVHFCTYARNEPLGQKHNLGAWHIIQRSEHYDYVMQLGSDDFLSVDYLNHAVSRMIVHVPYFGVDRLIFYNASSGEQKECRTPDIFGAGRCVRMDVFRSAFKMYDGLWNDRQDKGLDLESDTRIMTYLKSPCDRISSAMPMVMDVKTDLNIWSYSSWEGQPSTFDLVKMFPEIKKIKNLKKNN